MGEYVQAEGTAHERGGEGEQHISQWGQLVYFIADSSSLVLVWGSDWVLQFKCLRLQCYSHLFGGKSL